MSWEFPEYPDNWDEIREAAKKRDGYRCVKCGSQKSLHVHHKIPLNKGGTNSLDVIILNTRITSTYQKNSSGEPAKLRSVLTLGKLLITHRDVAECAGVM